MVDEDEEDPDAEEVVADEELGEGEMLTNSAACDWNPVSDETVKRKQSRKDGLGQLLTSQETKFYEIICHTNSNRLT